MATEADYTCRLDRFKDQELAKRFLRLERDEETQAFIDSCRGWSGSTNAIWKDVLAGCLRSCCSLTTTNAILGIGSMHVLSSHHLRIILGDRT